jgi:hypothetical protein
MMTEKRDDAADGELVRVVSADPQHSLRIAFGAAMAALMERIPAGYARDIALTEIIAAHERAEHAIARRRVLN